MKKSIKKIIIIQFFVLLIYILFFCINSSKEQIHIETALDTWKSSYVEFQDENWHIIPEIAEAKRVEQNEERARWGLDEITEKEVTFLSSPDIAVSRGDYTVTVWYECDMNQSFQPYHNGTGDGYVKSSRVILDKAAKMVSYDFRVTKDIDDLQLKFQYNGNGELSITGVAICKNNNDLKRNIVCLVMACLILNFCFFYHVSSVEQKKYLLSVIGIVLLASLPLFYMGLDGHDLQFHLNRIEGIARELKYGHFPVRIQSTWMAEYGYPVSIFYGDVLLYIPALLRILGFSIDEAYKMYVFLINLASVLIAEKSFNKIFQKKSTGLLLTLLYVTSSYRMTDVFVRGAVGEYTALIFLPMIALATYNICCGRKNLKNAIIIAVGMAGIITSHVLTAEIVAFGLLLVCVVCWKNVFTVNGIRTYIVAIIGTLLLSAGFLIPFVDYYLNVPVEITNTVSGTALSAIQAKGASFSDLFVFFSNPFGNYETILLTPGIILMVGYIAAIMLCYIKKADAKIKKLTALSTIVLWMSTNLFPWDSLAYESTMFNMLAQVQFPWRFLGIAIMFLTLLIGFVLEHSEVASYVKCSTIKVIRVCVATTVVMTFVFTGYYSDDLNRNIYYDTANLNNWDIMGEEYKRVGTSTYQFEGEILGEGIVFAEISSREGCEMDIQCKAGKEGATVIFPVINYKGYEVTDDAGNYYEVIDDLDNSLVSIQLPAEFEGRLSLRYVEPLYWNVAFAISIITAGMIATICVTKKVRHIYNIKKEREHK